jgi:uncharacterized delta-60 repeat protein
MVGKAAGIAAKGRQARNRRDSLFMLVAVGLLAFFAMSASALAAPGDLDSTFGTGGIVTSDLEEAGASDVAIQSDGKLVVAGSTGGCSESGGEFTCHGEFLIERYNLNGTLDTSFGGGDGIVTTDFGYESQGAAAVVIEPSGKILVGGATSEFQGGPSISAFALARYNSDGSLDTSFGGGDGKVSTEFSDSEGAHVWSGSLVRKPSGKIVLGGEIYVHDGFGTWHMALAGYNSDGSVDTSFGTSGQVVGPAGQLYGLAEEPGGKLLAAGRAGNYEFAVTRFNADGSLDTGFANNGIATLDLSPVGSQADDVLVQPDGKIVASGFGSGYGFAVARFNVDGTPDSTFGGSDGLVLTHFSQPCCGLGAAISVALQADGRIVFSGQWTPDEDSLNDEWAVGRLNPNGAPDKSFGTNGLVTTDVAGGGYGNDANGVAIQSDGKIVAVGGTGAPNQDLAVARYEGGGSPPPTYHHLLVAKQGPGSGGVYAPELNCGANCGADYVEGETVTVGVFAKPESTFTGWSASSGNPGTCTGTTAPCEVTLNGNVELVANFSGGSPTQYSLTTSKGGSGSGTVTSSPIGIDCGATCSHAFNAGTSITLTATPAAGSTFAGWSGSGCSGTGVCEISLAADVAVTATFTASEGGGSQTPTPTPEPQPTPKKKPLKCRKGFKKRKVHGKARCVRIKHRHR